MRARSVRRIIQVVARGKVASNHTDTSQDIKEGFLLQNNASALSYIAVRVYL